jgi:hypothetical protein
LKASKEVEVVVERPTDIHMEVELKMKRRVKGLVPTRIKREINHIILEIKIMDTKEEEEDLGKDQEEEASTKLIFNVGKKYIEPMSVLNIKEGIIEDLKVTLKLPMWMKMQILHILKILKEERPLLLEEPC